MDTRVKWIRDHGLDHAVEKEKHLQPVLQPIHLRWAVQIPPCRSEKPTTAQIQNFHRYPSRSTVARSPSSSEPLCLVPSPPPPSEPATAFDASCEPPLPDRSWSHPLPIRGRDYPGILPHRLQRPIGLNQRRPPPVSPFSGHYPSSTTPTPSDHLPHGFPLSGTLLFRTCTGHRHLRHLPMPESAVCQIRAGSLFPDQCPQPSQPLSVVPLFRRPRLLHLACRALLFTKRAVVGAPPLSVPPCRP